MNQSDKKNRTIGAVSFGLLGGWLGYYFSRSVTTSNLYPIRALIVSAIIGAVLGFFLVVPLIVHPVRRLRVKLENESSEKVAAATIGLIFGLVAAALFSIPASFLPDPLGEVLPFLIALLLGYLGVYAGISKINWFRKFMPPRFFEPEESDENEKITLVDSSAIIDGRIAEIVRTGFLQGKLVVPNFVLQEIQFIADSEDILKRQRGRRGLEVLRQLQKEFPAQVEIRDIAVENIRDVDGKLIALAKKINCPILTDDYNLNQVANLQGITILNINDLSNAVKSVILPGETLMIHVLQEGKEYNQGVGYIEDGTMVVVENGRMYIGQEISVMVTKIHQTAIGRMIFAKPETEMEQQPYEYTNIQYADEKKRTV